MHVCGTGVEAGADQDGHDTSLPHDADNSRGAVQTLNPIYH